MRILLALILIFSGASQAGKNEALALMDAGRYQEAYQEFQILASSGDTVAMVTIGNMFYSDQLGPNYDEAYKWWQKAFDARNADALVNIGVLYRDGKGVTKNLEVAYDIFIIVHMRGLGTQNTQVRNGGNLQKTIALLDKKKIFDALCYSEEYVLRYIESKGISVEATKENEVKIKNKDWWLEGELPKFEC